jgi:hypothetical protein
MFITDTIVAGIGVTTDKCSRSFFISSKEECDKWIAVITKHITALSVHQVNCAFLFSGVFYSFWYWVVKVVRNVGKYVTVRVLPSTFLILFLFLI